MSPSETFQQLLHAVPELVPTTDAGHGTADGGDPDVSVHVSAGATLATLGVACLCFAFDAGRDPRAALGDLGGLLFATDVAASLTTSQELTEIRHQVQGISEASLHGGMRHLQNATIAASEGNDSEVSRQLERSEESFIHYCAIAQARSDPTAHANGQLWLAAVEMLRGQTTLAAQALRGAATSANELLVRAAGTAKAASNPWAALRSSTGGRRAQMRAAFQGHRGVTDAVAEAEAIRRSVELLDSAARLNAPLPPPVTVDDTPGVPGGVADRFSKLTQGATAFAAREVQKHAAATAKAADITSRTATRLADLAAARATSQRPQVASDSETADSVPDGPPVPPTTPGEEG